MDSINEKQDKTKESLDSQWVRNRNRLEGSHGVEILSNDNKDLISRLLKAIKDVGGLPGDMNNPKTLEQVEAVDPYATAIYDLACDIAQVAEDLMVGSQVERAYEDIQDEKGNTSDMYAETGHKRSNF